MSSSRNESKKDNTLNSSQLDFLRTFIGPINDNLLSDDYENSVGVHIQVIFESESIDIDNQLRFLKAATEKNQEEFNTYLKRFKLPKDELDSLKAINNFCFDNKIKFKIEGYGLHTHYQDRTTSQHYFWALTDLSKFKNSDNPLTEMSKKDKENAKNLSIALQDESKRLILATCNYLKKLSIVHNAITTQNFEKLNASLKDISNIDSCTLSGMSPIHFAAVNGNNKIIEALIEKKADPDATYKNSLTPLLWAVFNNKIEIVQTLLDKNADPNKTMTDKLTALLVAAWRGHTNAIK